MRKGRWAVKSFTGRERPVVAAPEPAEMGSVIEALMVALWHGGAATMAAGVASAKITVSADHIRGLTAERISSLVNQQARRREINPRPALRGRGCSCRRSGPCGTRRSS